MTTFEIDYQTLEDSLFHATPEEERIARSAFAGRISKELMRQPDRADLYHLFGICLYEIPNWTGEEVREIENAFLKAIDLDEEAVFSRVFLTHFYFDTERFVESLAMNRTFDCANHRNVPKWRCCRMIELRLCCQILLQEISSLDINKLLKRIQQCVLSLDDDIADIAWPREVVELLQQTPSLANDVDQELLIWLQNAPP